ncbi:hypothetical protein TWF106_011141 [Orbilia oligospora]|uniref:Uncharacterized protein n=1 Tax=Orbilia oligospora TaxID=2813651 RepID=A0A6G1ME22_ORBOL|nr:hypothetical protein TWF679_008598 [Orbilia oligospora]KAF3208932.1 hypothetical protein TWF106_011141 [Orbilia oligospora]KAF3218551.1 hypothetical protein TWF191_008221 [Orbilia oligospora]KAF3254944.1 hypothetical protein TWF192_003025 [Orbilia oligospora]
MPGSFTERAPYRAPVVGTTFETIKVEPEEFSLGGTQISSAIAGLSSDSLYKHAPSGNLLFQSHCHEVIVRVSLVASNRMIELILNEDDPLEKVLQVVKPRILAVYFETSGYFAPYPAGTPEWTIDLTFGDLSLLNMVNLIAYRGESQQTLLIKDVFYGGETLEPRIFQLTSPRESGAPGPPIEFKWDSKTKQWVPQAAPGEMLLMDAQLAIHENILYTPFTHAKGSLSLTSMKLCYLRNLNDRLKTPAASVGYVSAVVFVGIGDIKMAVVKSYAWKKDPSKGLGEILEWDDDKGVCMVRDGTGQERTLKFRPNRLVWVEG